MSELTKEYFDQTIVKLTTKEHFDQTTDKLISKKHFEQTIGKLTTKEQFEQTIGKLTTKEHFDQTIGKLATKVHLDDSIYNLKTELTDVVHKEVEGLARMVSHGFEDIQTRLDVKERVQNLELDMKDVKMKLNLNQKTA